MNINPSMIETSAPRRPIMSMIFRVLVIFDAVALLFAAALHIQGARIPLGFATFDEPQIVPAAIVEGTAGLIFAVAAYAVFAGKRWAWPWTLFAHIFAILGFLVGIFATRNGTSAFNHAYHYVMLGIFVIGLALLLTSRAKTALAGNASRVRRG